MAPAGCRRTSRSPGRTPRSAPSGSPTVPTRCTRTPWPRPRSPDTQRSRPMDETELRERVDRLLADHPPASTDRLGFLHARFDAGLAWVHFPEGLGGLGLPRGM